MYVPADRVEDRVERLTALDLELVDDERLITFPVLESYTLPELSTILVLGEEEALLVLTEERLLPETAFLVETVEFLPAKALRVLPLALRPETFAIDEVPL